jgi:hypothetical protein
VNKPQKDQIPTEEEAEEEITITTEGTTEVDEHTRGTLTSTVISLPQTNSRVEMNYYQDVFLTMVHIHTETYLTSQLSS